VSEQTPDPFTQSLNSVQALLLSFADVNAFLQDLARLAAGMLPGGSAAITTRYNGTDLTVASSDERAELLDETQYRNGGGPCLDALATGRVVMSRDTASETRWPTYSNAARRYGLRASLSLPMIVAGSTLAAVNVYSFDTAAAFGPEEVTQYEGFAAQAAISLRLATRHEKDGILLAQLEAALNSRTVIDQALGIIMMQQRCTSAEAFDLLRRQSQNSHRKLREIATDLVTQTSGQPPAPGRPFTVD
jgi:GAF domain-containing protein